MKNNLKKYKRHYLLALLFVSVFSMTTILTNYLIQAEQLSAENAALTADVAEASDGTDHGIVKAWGDNVFGQLGDGTTTVRHTPVVSFWLNSDIVAVSGGQRHSCALTSSGTVKCVGWNAYGQLGDGTTTNSYIPVDVCADAACTTNLSGVIAISVGSAHSCALTSSGGVKCWGYSFGGLGNGTTNSITPADVCADATCTTSLSGVTAIDAGDSHTCAVVSGGAKCWGSNSFDGRLGDGTATNRTTPVDVCANAACNTNLSGVSAISAGNFHTCALVNGGAKCWGRNGDGRVGDGTGTWRLTPADVCADAACATNLSNVTDIGAGGGHSCALTSSGEMKCWGSNSFGQLGDSTTTNRLTPVNVCVDASCTTNLSGIDAISTGSFTCALTSSGGAKCWGINSYGQLGDGTTTHRSAPVDVIGMSSGVLAIDAGPNHTLAITQAPTADASSTQLFINDTDDSGSEDVALDASGSVDNIEITNYTWTEGAVTHYTGPDSTTSVPLSVDVHEITLTVADGDGFTDTITISVSIFPSSSLADPLKAWGWNSYGQVGDGTTTNQNTPIDLSGFTNGNVVSVAVGQFHTCVLTTLGSVMCWGNNQYGQLGDGTVISQFDPVIVSGLTSGVEAISAGNYYTCALLTSTGGVKCWGQNTSSQLGDGTTTQRITPVDVSGLTSGVSEIIGGRFHTCALTDIGGAKCWGQNTNGQLGDGTITQRTTPVDVFGLTSGVSAVSTGDYHTCAIVSGGMKCWGRNWHGRLGDGTTTQRTTPVDVSGLTSGVAAISLGSNHTCALTDSGGVKCWGFNYNGQLGDGTTTQRTTPVDVSGLNSGVTTISSGPSFNCALTDTDGFKCWGHNSFGSLGDGTNTQRTTPVDVYGLTEIQAVFAGRGYHTFALLASSDFDGDGVNDDVDNCPFVSNSDQTNTDQFPDPNYPTVINDELGDACDNDDDGDGFSDVEEGVYSSDFCLIAFNGTGTIHTNPLHPDTDDDGVLDGEEIYLTTTYPCIPDSDDDESFPTLDGFEWYGPDGVRGEYNGVNDDLNPTNPDTDGDGITDGLEMDFWLIRAGLDPKDPNLTVEQLNDAVQKCQLPDPDDPDDINGTDVDGDGVPDGADGDPEDPNVWEAGAIHVSVTANLLKADGTPSQELLENVMVLAYDLDDSCVKEHAPSGTDVYDNHCPADQFCFTNGDGDCSLPVALGQYFVMVKSLNHPGRYPAQTVPVTKIDKIKYANFSFLAE